MKNYFFIFCMCMFSSPIFAIESSSKKLEQFINDTLKEGYQILHSGFSEERLKVEIEILVKKIFDLDWLTGFLLGKEGTKYSQTLVSEFKQEYVKYLVSIYHQYAMSYRGEQVRVLNIHKIKEDFFSVQTSLIKTNGDLSIEYLLKELDNTYKILDIKTQNVSLVHTHKSEFANFLSKHDLSELIRTMQKHNSSR